MKIADVWKAQGSELFTRGETVFRRGSVTPLPAKEGELCFRVGTQPPCEATLYDNGEIFCTCGEAECAHAVAAALRAKEDGTLQGLMHARALRQGEKLLTALSRTTPHGESVRMVIALKLSAQGRIGLGLSMGQERLYAVASIARLLDAFETGQPLELSAKFTYYPSQMTLSKADEGFLALLSSHMEPSAEAEEQEESAASLRTASSDGRFVLLTGAFLQSVLRYLEKQPFVLLNGLEKRPQTSIQAVELPLCFAVTQVGETLQIQARGAESMTVLTPDGRYALYEGKLVHLHSRQAIIAPLVAGDGTMFAFPASDAAATLGTLLPALSAVGTVMPSEELARRLITEPLKAKAYLDLQDGDIVARVELCYGDEVLSPFEQTEQIAFTKEERPALLLRDGRAESDLLSFFSDAGFVVRSGRIYLRRARDILAFCTQGVSELGKLCEVYVSPAFEKIKPRRFSGKASFRMREGRLVLELLEEGQPVAEPLAILQAVQQRQQYVRLKTGEFLDIRDMAALSPVAQELLDAAALDRAPDTGERELCFSAYRASYLLSMLRMSGGNVEATEEVESIASAIGKGTEETEKYIPRRLQKKLVPYQKRGAGWLMSLYDARMGGVLADEMGLGKTVQVIAALSAAKARDGTRKSVIVTPTSLIYHWLAEFKRFDENMVVRLISGQREERRRTIAEVLADDTVDVLLTTYPLLRRDIEFLRDVSMRFAILDEAQFVKNAQSLGALAAKDLNAQVHIALTGTPMENHTGELWSIFDFVLPGYLGTQASFLRRYGGGERAEELQERIRPFLLRRLKREVMSDLPEKREHSLYAAMTDEQGKVYAQLLGALREHVDTALKEGSLPRARMQVLSVLLKLRQVCCHPKLFLPDYEGTSGKLELLISTIQSAIVEKRRMLVFSQFVGMLHIIRKRLAREGVRALYLDGSTKPELRQELCDRFNGGEGQVFLISLKAGGTGLNLTGADLVIHYDPWWNPAAEDQATDRAHRIGQTKDVDVIKLIAQDTIEEKVVGLSRRKRAIFDRVVMAGETALSSLTEEDIRALFF